jgi:muramidase (phage lysozyme)
MKKSVKEEVIALIKELELDCSVEEFMQELKHEVSWYDISKNKNLSENFIREFQDIVNWRWISIHQKLSEGFIREFKNKVYWEWISAFQKLSEGFIREFKDKVSWIWISQCQKLSEDFIREFKDKVDWEWISAFQKLSEGFIREFIDKVSWRCISKYQKLSESFIREFKDEVNWGHISAYQKLSEGFIREFKLKIDPDNWLYKNKEFKLKKRKETGLYEFLDADHILAYKGIRSDRYSSFNFQYQYLKEGTYECHCDCTSSENSFGLSAWTEEKARGHCGELVIKVKINVADIGRIVHNGGKLRCSKFTVID